MAIYHLTLLRSGPVAHPYHITAGLSGITLENGDEILEIPTEFEGYPVTEIGYYESIDPAHEHFHDWHHPAQGAEWVPDTYQTHSCSIHLDERVKRVILPPTVRYLHLPPFEGADHVIYELDEACPFYKVVDGKVMRK